MNKFVVDASVGAKWILPAAQEPFSVQAVSLLRDWTDDKISLIIPDFFWIEVANVMWKAIRRGTIARAGAESGMKSLRQRKIPTVRFLGLLDSAFDTAVLHDRSVYDSLYVALAVEAKATLLTADEKLAKALGPYFPVKWLGTI